MIVVTIWLTVAIHAAVGLITWRRPGGPPLVPLVNLAIGAAILVYWVQEWYGYLTQGIHWYWIDQLVPLYAIVIVILAFLALSGRYPGTILNRVIFGVDGVVILAFGLLIPFLKFDRMF